VYVLPTGCHHEGGMGKLLYKLDLPAPPQLAGVEHRNEKN